ncbi:glycosyl transferase [Christiangramia fulva]|uniref:Glycosyl transferase n=2 Tax=Christiangramia fulva TaxID=2126553 RepID=A0A2R3ZAL4_9FLAO|nr:glycosyl transferase [Christiangramia fulva]
MIILLHSNARKFIHTSRDGKELLLESRSLVNAFWEVAEKFPEELIIWRDQDIDPIIADNIEECFPHELIMSSFPIVNQYIPDQIGYIDQLPFVNPNYEVVYPTWRMSTDIGGTYGKTALRFRDTFKEITSFGYLLNSIAKTGQQNGLFCYTNPNLTESNQTIKLSFNSTDDELFRFVAQHYKKEWLWILLFCFWRYEKRLLLIPFLKSLGKKSFFKQKIHLPIHEIRREKVSNESEDIDVIVPTLLRSEHLRNLLVDLSKQSKLPNRVIIVEQDPDPASVSQLEFLKEKWSFEVIHHFVHRTGACHARNLAMKSVTAKYIFFADDDIRLETDLLEKTLAEINRLGVGCINLNCLQPGEQSVFPKIKQWGAFGSGTSVVKSEYALKCEFSEFLEKGFGEDIDYGLQLRSKGCDIIYHPDLQFVHLKAERGGFREVMKGQDSPEEEPKPSPTMMYLVKSAYTQIMQRGYKVSLFIKYYRKQSIKNPFRYFGSMKRRWRLSERLCEELNNAK